MCESEPLGLCMGPAQRTLGHPRDVLDHDVDSWEEVCRGSSARRHRRLMPLAIATRKLLPTKPWYRVLSRELSSPDLEWLMSVRPSTRSILARRSIPSAGPRSPAHDACRTPA